MNRNTLIAGLVLVAVVWGLKALSGGTPETVPSQPSQPTPVIAIDRPSLYASDAIRIARQHALTTPVNASERHAATHIRRLEALDYYEWLDFEATYQGNGEWIVLLRVLAEPGQPQNYWLYRWRVFDKTSSVVFLDETVLYP